MNEIYERDIADAQFYCGIGWDRLEFEERAHARELARKGYLINLGQRMSVTNPVIKEVR